MKDADKQIAFVRNLFFLIFTAVHLNTENVIKTNLNYQLFIIRAVFSEQY